MQTSRHKLCRIINGLQRTKFDYTFLPEGTFHCERHSLMVPDDTNFRLFCLLHGEAKHSPLYLGSIPNVVAVSLGWKARKVYITPPDAQKIRYHPMHGMDATKGLQLPLVISHGDYYKSNRRGSQLQIEVALREIDNLKRAYFLVLSRNKEDTGIFIRTFYFASELSRNKLTKSTVLLVQSAMK